MMKKRSLILMALCLLCIHLTAEDWTVNYIGAYPSGFTRFFDGFIDEDGVTFLAGREGSDLESPEALLMRIEPDGNHTEFKYQRPSCLSQATSIIEMPNHKLFVAGNLYGPDDDFVMILILDKQLNLIEERQYQKEVEAVTFMACKAKLDSHNHVIVSTAVKQANEYQGFDLHGLFLKFDEQGNLLNRRYLIEDYPDPLFYFKDFRVRQMWYKAPDEAILCLAAGSYGVLSFVTFDSAFNLIEEHQIWRDSIDKSDHTINRNDCYIDHWYNEDEALVFSSYGSSDRNKLRASKINTQGEILEMIRINERTDTIDDAAISRCMASVNDGMFYFSFHYHIWGYYPGIACVYLLNEHLDIVGRHIDDDHESYWTDLILPTADNGCITVNDSCSHTELGLIRHPVIKKLTPEDFETFYWSTAERPSTHAGASQKCYPNPTSGILNITVPLDYTESLRCRIIDPRGLLVCDHAIDQTSQVISIDVSCLKAGLYQYQIYSNDRTLLTEKFVKK